MAALAEEELIEKLAGRVTARLGGMQATKKQMDSRSVREKAAARSLGMSVFNLQTRRSKGTGPSFTKVGSLMLCLVEELEKYMEQRTVEGR